MDLSPCLDECVDILRDAQAACNRVSGKQNSDACKKAAQEQFLKCINKCMQKFFEERERNFFPQPEPTPTSTTTTTTTTPATTPTTTTTTTTTAPVTSAPSEPSWSELRWAHVDEQNKGVVRVIYDEDAPTCLEIHNTGGPAISGKLRIIVDGEVKETLEYGSHTSLCHCGKKIAVQAVGGFTTYQYRKCKPR